eukprot:CAMPEP_0201480382 /NCGR_PEP_ID=MMETSP0151_2-20130828/4871_1 /ASSEMBLY_ACC=CAM_ASM_000257 /TAXON_ID=200890 /ORGANISM="Paramoeba atlantica, Strain 621/1 / CCAP 1560/9" /LENGTH=307 /DNA_ID=CAMNT_0047862211 /DNA_START=66 /DNA_END=986 /DNA_ORIENTATION=+
MGQMWSWCLRPAGFIDGSPPFMIKGSENEQEVVFEFSEKMDIWEPVTSSSSSSSPKENLTSLTFLTYNIWFSEYHQEQRYKQLVNLICEKKPQIACFQEVIPEFVRIICANKTIQQNYFVSETPSNLFCSEFRNYGEMMIISKEIGPPGSISFFPFESSFMGRKFLFARWPDSTQLPSVGTVHLESLDSSGERHKQLQAITQDVFKDSDNALFMGDFNFAAHWQENKHHFGGSLANYDDIWALLHPKDPGNTFDAERNENLKKERAGEPRRIDRVVIKQSPTRPWFAEKIQLLGTDPFQSVDGSDVW